MYQELVHALGVQSVKFPVLLEKQLRQGGQVLKDRLRF